jgi:hypothetical protein
VDVEVRTKDVERALQKRRLELMDEQKALQDFKDELDILKSELGTCTCACARVGRGCRTRVGLGGGPTC